MMGKGSGIVLTLLLWASACSGSGPVNYVDTREPEDVRLADRPGIPDEDAAPLPDVLDEGLDGGAPDGWPEEAAGDLEDASEPDGSADLVDVAEPDGSADVPAELPFEESVSEEVVEEVAPEVVVEPTWETEVVLVSDDAPWAETRLVEVSHGALTADKFIDKTSHFDPALAALFDGDPTPSSGRFLLHVGTGCADSPSQAVFLVHGAGGTARDVWVEPALFGDGLAVTLTDTDHCVYAITFPHPFGSNFNQAIQLAAALELARLDSGLDKLDVVAHSKGGIVAVTYASGFAGAEVGAPYGDDIDRLVLLGVPLGGIDFSFRHPSFNYPAELYNLAMPTSWDQILEWGVWQDIYDESIYGGAFDGVLQMLVAWDEVYALSMFEQDWYSTYYGGDGYVSHSLGIAAAIDMGGNFMAKLDDHEVPASIACHVGTGGTALIGGVPWEGTGPSDGMVFTASAETTGQLGNLVETHHFPLLNHWDLVASQAAQNWVAQTLD